MAFISIYGIVLLVILGLVSLALKNLYIYLSLQTSHGDWKRLWMGRRA